MLSRIQPNNNLLLSKIFWSIIDDLDNQTGEQTLKGLQRPESTRYYKTIFIKHT